jgi:hypothetical protein
MNKPGTALVTEEGIDFFKERGYCIVRQAIEPGLAQVFENYTLMQRFNKYYLNDDVTHSKWRYSDVFGESLLLHLQPLMEKISGLSLYPTNSVLRIYHKGGILKKHVDRPTCEISATLTVGYDAKDPYPIWVQSMGEKIAVSLQRGDLLAYKGCEIPHWREEFKERHWIQLFLHYVDANGPNAKYKNDGRLMIGMNEGKVLLGDQPKY